MDRDAWVEAELGCGIGGWKKGGATGSRSGVSSW